MNYIYLDNNATTALDPLVLEAMLHDLKANPHNPSSIHRFGREAKALLTSARHAVSDYFKVRPSEILFTSGGTEGINLLLNHISSGHLITSSIEHSAVLNKVEDLASRGVRVTTLSPGLYGMPLPSQIEEAICKDTTMIALSAANSETGSLLDLESVARIAEIYNIPLMIDGVALLGKEIFSIPSGVTGMAFSGHKIHAPKGVGCVVVRKNTPLSPLILGGGQERGLRCGTENLSGILGLQKAIELIHPSAIENMRSLRDDFEKRLITSFSDITIHGKGPRLSNTSNFSIKGIEGDALIMQLDMKGIAVSHGSACSSGALEPSHVLLNMGHTRSDALSAVRLSLSRFTTFAELDHTLHAIQELVSRMATL